jgi:apolipoprotein N-acyltransferase
VSFLRNRRGPLLAAGSGFVFAASTPPIDFQPGILIGLVGFALALRTFFDRSLGERSSEAAPAGGPDAASSSDPSGKVMRAGAWRGFWFGLAANLLALRFVPEVMSRFTPLPAIAGWVALLLLSAAQALPWTIGGVDAAKTKPLPAASKGPRRLRRKDTPRF